MRLSFFIKPHTRVLREIEKLLKDAGFDVKTSGQVENDRIVVFNEKSGNNFCFSAHKLMKDPSVIFSVPFLVRVGSNWTLHGLVTVLEGYLAFKIPYFRPIHFPSEADFSRDAESDEDLLKRLNRIQRTIRNCHHGTEKELMEIKQVLQNLKEKSSGRVKREIFYFLMDNGRVNPPWGNPPSGLKSRNIYIDWLKKANKAFPRKASTDRRFREDIFKIKEMKGVQSLKLI